MDLKPNMKSDFDEFLKEEDVLIEAERTAIKRVIAYQIKQEMETQNITKQDVKGYICYLLESEVMVGNNIV